MATEFTCPECGEQDFYVIISQRQVWHLDPDTLKMTTPGDTFEADDPRAVFNCAQCGESLQDGEQFAAMWEAMLSA